MFQKDQKLIERLLRVASTHERDSMPATADLLRKAAYRLEKLAKRHQARSPEDIL
jgi:hypothetical protein